MFQARKILQPMIPQSAAEFCEVLPTTTFAVNLKATINVDGRVAVIFFLTNYMISSQISLISNLTEHLHRT